MSRGRHRPPQSLALGDKERSLFDAHLGSVEKAAKYLSRRLAVDVDEALSACFMTLVTIAQRFDPSRGSVRPFLWKALYRAVQRVKREDRTIHVPGRFFDGIMPDHHADHARRAAGALRLYYDRWRDLPIADQTSPEPEAMLIEMEETELLYRLLGRLPSRSRIIVLARARGIGLKTLGDCFGVTGSRIQQIERNAIDTLRGYIREIMGSGEGAG